jgi:hypothetical protein
VNMPLREFARWEEFPAGPSVRYTRTGAHPAIELINRHAENVLETIVVASPVSYVTLFLAYLAVTLGIIA